MRILVFSDSHGRGDAIRDAMFDHPEAGNIIFTGDGVREMESIAGEFPDVNTYVVKGNCDFGAGTPDEMVIELAGTRIFFTHGHKYSVKSGTGTIAAAARRCGASICLYGHTHEPYTVYDGGLYIMNPGTVGGARTGVKTYGMIDITQSGIMCIIAKL